MNAASRIRCALVVALCSLTGCGAAYRHHVVPGEGGHPWFELQTPHFRIRTNVDEEVVPSVGQRLEDLRAAMVAALQIDPPLQVEVIHFRDQYSFDQFQSGFAGFAVAGLDRPLLVMVADDFYRGTDHKGSVVAHELAHHFYSYLLVRSTRWVTEGLATYLESLNLKGSTAVEGQAPYYDYLLAREGIRPIKDLFEWGRWAPGDHDAAYYAQSWAWVHFLQNEHRERWAAFLARLAKAEDPRHAFDEVFWDQDYEALHRRVNAYVFENLAVREFPFTEAAFEPRVRALSDGEVESLFALMYWMSPGAAEAERRQPARRELVRALKLEPRLLEARLLQVKLAPEGEVPALISALVADFPASEEGWLELADHASRTGDQAGRQKAAEEAYRLRPDSSRVLVALAKLRLEQGRADEALELAQRAQLAAPWFHLAADAVSAALAAQGRCAESESFAQRALDLSSERLDDAKAAELRKQTVERKKSCVAKETQAPAVAFPEPPRPAPVSAAAAPRAATERTPPIDRALAKNNGAFFIGFGGVVSALGLTFTAVGIGYHSVLWRAGPQTPLVEAFDAAWIAEGLYTAGAVTLAVGGVAIGAGLFQLHLAKAPAPRLTLSVSPTGVAIGGVFP